MKRLAWMTDIHFNFLGTQQIEQFINTIREAQPDGLLISGDIGEAHSVGDYLQKLAADLQLPLYFVLGNHDFYFGSIEHVRAGMGKLGEDVPLLCWLPQAGVVQLAEEVALVGHDGWADAGYGDYANSKLMLNDYLLIQELAALDFETRRQRLNALGAESASYLRETLATALQHYTQVYVVTHVPPFEESCLYDGQAASDQALPHFANKAAGDVLREMAEAHPDRQITVLCGHTHATAIFQAAPNLLVLTGSATYGAPIVQQVFELNG